MPYSHSGQKGNFNNFLFFGSISHAIASPLSILINLLKLSITTVNILVLFSNLGGETFFLSSLTMMLAIFVDVLLYFVDVLLSFF